MKLLETKLENIEIKNNDIFDYATSSGEFKIVQSNWLKMRFFLEHISTLEKLSDQNIDIVELGKDVDFIGKVLVMIEKNKWKYGEYMEEENNVKYYFKLQYNFIISLLRDYSFDSMEYIQWIDNRLQ